MGIGQIEVARLLEYGKEGRLFIESLPNVALLHTYSANNIVTDSVAPVRPSRQELRPTTK